MLSGTPLAYPSGGQAQLYRVQPRPVPTTRPTRRNTFDSLLANYGLPAAGAPLQAGHDQGLFNPLHASANLQFGGGLPIVVAGRRNNLPRNQNQQGGPGVLANGNNACFAAAGIAFITALEVTSYYVVYVASNQLEENVHCTE
jgi:hypothetical protein